MRIRRPIKYVLVIAGLAAGWAAGGLLERRAEENPAPPAGHRQPQSRPQSRPATRQASLFPLPPGEG